MAPMVSSCSSPPVLRQKKQKNQNLFHARLGGRFVIGNNSSNQSEETALLLVVTVTSLARRKHERRPRLALYSVVSAVHMPCGSRAPCSAGQRAHSESVNGGGGSCVAACLFPQAIFSFLVRQSFLVWWTRNCACTRTVILRAKRKKKKKKRGRGVWLIWAQGCPLVAEMRKLQPTDALTSSEGSASQSG